MNELGLSLSIEDAPIFRRLSAEETESIRARVKLKDFSAGDEILRAGDASPGLFVIRSGLVAVTVRHADGSEREVGRLGSGECLGEMALLTGEPCSSTVRVLSKTEAWLLEPDDFLEITEEFPAIWRNFGRVLSQRLARTSRHLAEHAFAHTTVLVIDCPADEAAVIGSAAAESVARLTERATLLVDARADEVAPMRAFDSLKASPSFSAMLKDRTLFGEHDVSMADNNGTRAARICAMHKPGEREVSAEDALEVLDWLQRVYHHIIILAAPSRSAVRDKLLQHGSSLNVVIGSDAEASTPAWFIEQTQLMQPQARCKISVLAGGLVDTSVIQTIENETGQAVRRLPIWRGAAPGDDKFRSGIDQLARQIACKEVGLALGAGAAKGFAHIGVLTALQDHHVPVDFIAGTSIGAIVGALYVCGLHVDDIERLMNGADRKLARWTLPVHSIWSDAGLIQLLRRQGSELRFRDLPIPFATVATDITTGREAVLRRGIVWKAVQASVAVPGMFPPARNRGRVLVDGGLVNPVPGQTVRDLGADLVIAVDLMSPSARKHHDSQNRTGNSHKLRVPNLVEILWRANEIMQGEVTLRSAATADLTIEPKLGRVRWSDFSKRGAEYRAAGQDAALEKMAEIRELVSGAATANSSR